MRASSPRATRISQLYADMAKDAYKPFESLVAKARLPSALMTIAELAAVRIASSMRTGRACSPRFPRYDVHVSVNPARCGDAAILSPQTEGLKITPRSTTCALSGVASI